MYTITDYMAMAQELREMGQILLAQCDDETAWAEEVECMDMHLECCIHELMDCGVER